MRHKKCEKYEGGKRCTKEATLRYRHDLGTIIYRCDAHMESEYQMTATIAI